MLDIILLIIAFFLLVSMSDVMTPPFQPLWTEHEVPDADGVPRPEMHEVPGYSCISGVELKLSYRFPVCARVS